MDGKTLVIPPDANIDSTLNSEQIGRCVEYVSMQICIDATLRDDACISILEELLKNPNAGPIVNNGQWKINYTCLETIKFISAGLTNTCGDALINYIKRKPGTNILAIGANKFSEEMMLKMLSRFSR